MSDQSSISTGSNIAGAVASKTLSSWNSPNPFLRLAKAVTPKTLRVRTKFWLEKRLIGHLPIRQYLEKQVIPAVRSAGANRVLFVGVQHYTAHYRNFFAGREYWTIDFDPEAAEYGSPGRHVIGDAAEVAQYFGNGYFDAAFLNGVLGWGLDSEQQQNTAIGGLREVLKPGGILVLGWEESRTEDPVKLAAVQEHFRHEPRFGLEARRVFADFNQREHAGQSYIYDILTAR